MDRNQKRIAPLQTSKDLIGEVKDCPQADMIIDSIDAEAMERPFSIRDFPKQNVSARLLRELGNRVRKLRKERHFSQERFAEVCGLHRTAMGLIERGKCNSRLDTLLVISRALSIPVSRLLSGIEQFGSTISVRHHGGQRNGPSRNVRTRFSYPE